MKRDAVLTIALLSVLLAGCGAAPAPTSAPPTVAIAATSTKGPTPAPATQARATAPAPTATAEPKVGGRLVWAAKVEHEGWLNEAAAGPEATDGLRLIGATLISSDPEGQIVPYLAESWSVSPDGLTWDFELRKDVRFHDGTPLTATDYAWSIRRYLSPESTAAWTATFLPGVTGAEALDDYTLRLTLSAPQFYLLDKLSEEGYVQPQCEATVAKYGVNYGRHPNGVGPFKFKEWQSGEKIVLERNPDFTWGPAYTHGGPPYIETVEFRFLTEDATVMAGLEAFEIDYTWLIDANLERVRATGAYDVDKHVMPGVPMGLLMNVSRPPLDDLRVRQALSYALNRELLVKVVGETGEPVNTPLSPTTRGYWPGSKQLGYMFDLNKAKALMAEAGYVPGSNGVLEKDGKPLELDMLLHPNFEQATLVVQEQLKDLGVKAGIKPREIGALIEDLTAGNYDLFLVTFILPNASALSTAFDSKGIDGGVNYGRVNDPELDRLLRQMETTTDARVNQQAADDAQRLILERVYYVPLSATLTLSATSKRLGGIDRAPVGGSLRLFDAYFTDVK